MRAYRWLLRLYPASFRAEYGDELSAVFEERRREASGLVAHVGLWIGAIADTAPNAVRVHADIARQDLRYTLRTLSRAPGFAATAILVAGLGIGATTAAFAIADHVLVRPLPFQDPDQLVKLWQDQSYRGYSRMDVSPGNYRDWRQLSASFELMAPYTLKAANLVSTGTPIRIDGALAGADLFTVLGVRPALGRTFSPADDEAGAPGTLILSDRLWHVHFNADPAVVGRTIRLDDATYTIIGVMPGAFSFPTRDTDFWATFRFAPQAFEDRSDTFLQVIARLKRDTTIDRARADLAVIAAGLARAFPDANRGTGVTVIHLRDEVAPRTRLILGAVAGSAAGVLLLACTNLASLLLTRALGRRHELAVRTALGAGRERLVRQMLTESLALAAIGGALGLAIAVSAVPMLMQLAPNGLPIAERPAVDIRLLAVVSIVTSVAGLGFGVLPAWRAGRRASAGGLRDGVRAGVGRSAERLRSTLVVVQVTLSVALLVVSGLLIRALWRVQQIDPGFHAAGVLTLRTALPLPKYAPVARRADFYERVLADVRAVPGVTNAAYISFLPMVMRGGIWPVTLEGHPQDPSSPQMASLRYVTPGFFATMGIPLRQGRDIRDADTQDAPWVAVVSESFAAEHWPGEPPLGRQFQFAFKPRTTVGVVGNVRVRGLERSSEPQVYLPYRQVPDGSIQNYIPKDVVVRSTADTGALVATIRRAVAAVDPEQPISAVRSLEDVVGAETTPRAVQARMLGVCAALALLLSGIGLHGLLASGVSMRTREIGVRMALGATPGQVLASVAGQGLWLAAIGIGLGATVAYASGRAMEALLAGVSPADLLTFAVVIALSAGAAAVGSWLPARRAARVDPIRAMRVE
jgi:putative ABC transport system permease protein